MTQEEKLEEAKRLYKTANADQKYVLESLFPELKESEGEKMMRVLIGGLKSYVDMYSEWYDGVSTSEIIDWLEKKGEQTSDKIVEKARTEKQRVLLTETDGVANIDWDTRSLQDVKLLLEYGLDYIKKFEKQCEQKPAEWSEIDNANLEDSIYFVKEFRRSNLCDNESRLQNSRTCIEWLASLKDRVLPQPKQELSEEDKSIVTELIGIFESAVDGGYVDIPYRLLKDYTRVLKSCLPQNTWKPSEEQIVALRWVLNNVPYNKHKEEISGLLDQIKDL